VVEAAGAKVTRLRPGDEVVGAGTGSLAEYVLASLRATQKVLFISRRSVGRTYDQPHGWSPSAAAWARAWATARALRIGQQARVSRVMATKLHQKGAVSP
jgi:NADPH:quinone reductase-like Zn-dependent oxidoreductase